MTLEGRVALVTGAGGGIGAAASRMLAEYGAGVIVNDLSPSPQADALVRELNAGGSKAVFIAADVAGKDSVDHLYSEAMAAFGRVDILVNNAGIARANTMMDISEADWDAVIDVNLKGVFNTCKAFSRQMMDRSWGRIINISSIAGRRGSIFGDVHYSSAKAGVIGFTKCLAKIAAPYNVTANVIAPGIVKTPILSEAHETASQSGIPMGRTAAPEEIASVILFYASQLSSYVTGTVLDVNGGSYM